MRNRRKNWAFLLLPLMLLSGCWDRREIEEKSSVVALGADTCAEGQDCNLYITRQIAIPGRIPLGGGEGSQGDAKTVYVFSTGGIDDPDSTAKAQDELNRKISFGHLRIFLVSEALARQGMDDYLDYIRRLGETRKLKWFAIAEGRAEDVIRAVPPLERVPALFLNDMMEDARRTGRLPAIFMGDFETGVSNKGEDKAVPLIKMAGPDRPALAGLAVFRGSRMVGKLTPEETVTYMQLRGIRRGSERLELQLPPGHRANLVVYGRKVKYKLRWEGGRVHANLKLDLESELAQLSPGLTGSDPDLIKTLERKAADEVTTQANALVKKLQQEFNADLLAVGERVRAYLPSAWKSIDDWRAAFAGTQFSIDVTVHVRRTGMAAD